MKTKNMKMGFQEEAIPLRRLEYRQGVRGREVPIVEESVQPGGRSDVERYYIGNPISYSTVNYSAKNKI